MKTIFLDIDGVLWTVGWSIYCNRKFEKRQYEEWDPICSSNLQWVLDEAKEQSVPVQIVISSMWRIGRDLTELKRIAEKSGIDPNAVVGVTPVFRGREFDTERGHEIQAWMDKNNVLPEDIAIIDDDSDMVHLLPHLIKTDSHDGMGFLKALEVARKLGLRT